MKKTLIFISLFIFVLGLGCIYAADPNTATNTVSKPTFNYNLISGIKKGANLITPKSMVEF